MKNKMVTKRNKMILIVYILILNENNGYDFWSGTAPLRTELNVQNRYPFPTDINIIIFNLI